MGLEGVGKKEQWLPNPGVQEGEWPEFHGEMLYRPTLGKWLASRVGCPLAGARARGRESSCG